MRLLRFGSEQSRSIDRFGSREFHLAPLARTTESQISYARLGAGGIIGRHPAASRQVLAVVEGSGFVSGADGVEQAIAAGTAAVWEEGEEHLTRTDHGLVAIVIEGAGVETT